MARKRITQSDPMPPAVGVAPARSESGRLHASRVRESSDRIAAVIHTEETLRKNQPEPEAVALLAYSYWEQRGYHGGSPEQDWLRAEGELTQQHPSAAYV